MDIDKSTAELKSRVKDAQWKIESLILCIIYTTIVNDSRLSPFITTPAHLSIQLNADNLLAICLLVK
jgi:hypothetical protein